MDHHTQAWAINGNNARWQRMSINRLAQQVALNVFTRPEKTGFVVNVLLAVSAK